MLSETWNRENQTDITRLQNVEILYKKVLFYLQLNYHQVLNDHKVHSPRKGCWKSWVYLGISNISSYYWSSVFYLNMLCMFWIFFAATFGSLFESTEILLFICFPFAACMFSVYKFYTCYCFYIFPRICNNIVANQWYSHALYRTITHFLQHLPSKRCSNRYFLDYILFFLNLFQ